ncbi:hypothetical protein [Allokutzneria sp. NRRL B-24872]|uniref:hypothetical protein n=1 Tax=Allokutzneria sp. NRRL B-24872 TaxID=1137961 RepID=UPI000A3AC8EA|nr:hypothetical protein [Allokutzneria sp. NRRL B-24872]
MRARRVLPAIAFGLTLAGGLVAPTTAQAAPAGCWPYVSVFVDADLGGPAEGVGFCDAKYVNLGKTVRDQVSSWHFVGKVGDAACLIDTSAGREIVLDRIVLALGPPVGAKNVPSWANDRADAVRQC